MNRKEEPEMYWSHQSFSHLGKLRKEFVSSVGAIVNIVNGIYRKSHIVFLLSSYLPLSSAGTGRLYPRHRGKKDLKRAKVASHTDRDSLGEGVDPSKTTSKRWICIDLIYVKNATKMQPVPPYLPDL